VKIEAKEWLVWSNEHRAWWRPKRCGYTEHLAGAGLYTEKEADDCCESRSPNKKGELPPEEKMHISKASVDPDTFGALCRASRTRPRRSK
jgi:hypothetical protein